MDYIESNLLDGEEVQLFCRYHWFIFAPAAFAFLLSIISLFFGSWFLVGVFLIISLIIFFDRSLEYWSSEFGITNKRLMIKIGFIRRHTLELLLPKIETISIDQSIMGRIFNFGTVRVIGTGGTNNPYKMIPDPINFRKKIQNFSI